MAKVPIQDEKEAVALPNKTCHTVAMDQYEERLDDDEISKVEASLGMPLYDLAALAAFMGKTVKAVRVMVSRAKAAGDPLALPTSLVIPGTDGQRRFLRRDVAVWLVALRSRSAFRTQDKATEGSSPPVVRKRERGRPRKTDVATLDVGSSALSHGHYARMSVNR